MKKTKYTQCRLRNKDRYQTSWIPSKFAVMGMTLKIKDDNDQWENGWIVEGVYSEIDEPLDINKSIRGHRNNTGDSLPKIPQK